MTRVFQWTEDEDEIAPDAITIGISSDTRILTIAGIEFGEKTAVVFWPDWVGPNGPVEAALEGPMRVEAALERADALRAQHGFRRLVLWLQHQELWDERWGKLAHKPGL
ncbi:MAG TPA: hypothetical protein VGB81_04250 [Devosia sp.]|jgi:hypothetical protein